VTGQPGLETHQLAGLDDRERGFSRSVELEQTGEGYRAVLRYEAARLATDRYPTQEAALLTLIQTLHARGYRQLKTQRSFRNGVYLGARESWVEYPDAVQAEMPSAGFIAQLLNWVRRCTTSKSRP
jgi:hypothetical protein